MDRMIETIEYGAPTLEDSEKSNESDKNVVAMIAPLLVVAFGIFVAAIVLFIAERR